MNDDSNVKTSIPAKEKRDNEKRDEERDPKRHGSQVHQDSEAGGEPGEGRTGTKLGSTDS